MADKAKPVGDHDVMQMPDYIPHDTVNLVADLLMGNRKLDWDVAAHVVHVQGFIVHQFQGKPLVMDRGPGFTTKEEAAKALKAAYPDGEIKAGTRGADPKGFNWLALLPFLLQVLQEFFKK